MLRHMVQYQPPGQTLGFETCITLQKSLSTMNGTRRSRVQGGWGGEEGIRIPPSGRGRGSRCVVGNILVHSPAITTYSEGDGSLNNLPRVVNVSQVT